MVFLPGPCCKVAIEEGQRMHESLTKYIAAPLQIAGNHCSKRSFTPHYRNVPYFRINYNNLNHRPSIAYTFKD